MGFATLAAAAALASAVAAAPVFHTAKTAPEIGLDKALRAIEGDGTEIKLANILGRPGGNGSKAYEALLTPKAVTSLRALETKARGGCDYKQAMARGDLCGLDYDPISCHQFFAKDYGYRTLSETPRTAVIEQTDPSNRGSWDVVTYTMAKDKTGWRIDAIKCPKV